MQVRMPGQELFEGDKGARGEVSRENNKMSTPWVQRNGSSYQLPTTCHVVEEL